MAELRQALLQQSAAAAAAAAAPPPTICHLASDGVMNLTCMAENRYATFQVASQFNCLEFVAPNVTPENGVTDYIRDHTQGPQCSLAAAPAIVYR